MNQPLPFRVSLPSDCLPPYQPVSLEKLVGQFLQNAVVLWGARTGPPHSPFSLPRPGSRPFYRPIYPCNYPCHVSVVTSPVNAAVHRPSPTRRRSRDRPLSGQGRGPGAPAPGGGCASLPNAPLDAVFGQIHRRDLEAPGPDQGRRPSGTTPPAEHGGPGPFTPLRGPGCCEGSPAVTNPKGTLLGTRVLAAARGSVLGLVTARSCGTRWRPVSHIFAARVAIPFCAHCGTFLTRVREPGPRSRPTREASLGLGLTSVLPGDRPVGLAVTRHIVWGRWCRARSRRICRAT